MSSPFSVCLSVKISDLKMVSAASTYSFTLFRAAHPPAALFSRFTHVAEETAERRAEGRSDEWEEKLHNRSQMLEYFFSLSLSLVSS